MDLGKHQGLVYLLVRKAYKKNKYFSKYGFEVEDLAQEVLIKMIPRLKHYDPLKGTEMRFINMIVPQCLINILRDSGRKYNREPKVKVYPIDKLAVETKLPSYDQTHVDKLCKKLPENEKKILEKYLLKEKLTHSEVCKLRFIKDSLRPELLKSV